MDKALEEVRSVLVLGGTSDIAQAFCRRLATETRRTSPPTVILAGRHLDTLAITARQLNQAGLPNVHTASFDAADTASHAAFTHEVFTLHGTIDLVLIAFGALDDQDHLDRHVEATLALIRTNYLGAVSAILTLTPHLAAQGKGTIVVLSSTAAVLPRPSNSTYASTKAGLDAFCRGLADRLTHTGVRLLIIRPGHVRTKMTAHLPSPPLATTPDKVAAAICVSLAADRPITWVPARVRWAITALQHLPRFLLRRLP